MDPEAPRPRPVNRRQALSGLAGAGLALPLLAACGSGGDESASDSTPTGMTTSDSSGSSGSSDSSGSDGSDGTALVSASDVPVGSGVILSDPGVVVTQPTEGDFKAFSVTCTHQGCPVTSISSDGIVCPCHGSVFAISDGAPTAGPAPSALASVAIDVKDGEISTA
ncbi:Rieske (2Fe-2S) protein [Nocardioides acrostichi]|uniref:Cytochrome bc1 complex Rieske iron-sulfur subunit n=1 Tax=Nocardioides acrostichi TaxID=2784339 RepID=A0A930YD28_9ACTN|nr:Rieske (2Fe-2S) protein [Nocardioides acrostichi]MBF4162054.1 Rieske (2Fe-2S) protein [Nocardioides acrostichi]